MSPFAFEIRDRTDVQISNNPICDYAALPDVQQVVDAINVVMEC